MSRRRQLRDMIVMEENRRGTTTPRVRGHIDQHLTYLRQLLKDLDQDIHEAIRRTPLWHEKAEILQSFDGVGPKVSASSSPTCQSWAPCLALRLLPWPA